MEVLRNHLKQSMGFDTNMEGGFLARRRHLQALEQAAEHLQQGKAQLLGAWAGELLAEELRLAQQNLSEITGEFTSDDLLGRIFSSFCICLLYTSVIGTARVICHLASRRARQLVRFTFNEVIKRVFDVYVRTIGRFCRGRDVIPT